MAQQGQGSGPREAAALAGDIEGGVMGAEDPERAPVNLAAAGAYQAPKPSPVKRIVLCHWPVKSLASQHHTEPPSSVNRDFHWLGKGLSPRNGQGFVMR
jgi:hypothetical protein